MASNQQSVSTTENFQSIDDASVLTYVATSASNSARKIASDESSTTAFDQSPTSINDVDRVPAMAPESVRASVFAGAR